MNLPRANSFKHQLICNVFGNELDLSQVPSRCKKAWPGDFIHEVLNIVFPLTTVISLLIIFPPYLVFKLLSYIKRSISSEDVAGKVVLITGASSGIGEGLAYEYAKRGARLAIVARRKDRLQLVAAKARELGSPDVYVIRADIAKVNECQELVEKAVKHFGQLDHLVNNAGIVRVELFEDCRLSDSASVLDVNFWGAIYCTRFAISHLRKSRGKIAVNSSLAAWSPVPRTALYAASKAALVSFYEALRNECGSDIGITIVLLGLIESEMTAPDAASGPGSNQHHTKFLPPLESTKRCAEAILKSTCRGDKYLTEPSWPGALFMVKLLCPELFEWFIHWNFIS
ncbi:DEHYDROGENASE 2 putative-RELATED [Salix viminalis]|uniref:DEHYDROGENASE 2 putative-RELATED n=1 Tax=Salix viminalis TaxID=40686 RepID=A0A9Q0V528_SALVM|nr:DEHYDROGENASE 2 putative-RELATED [Salix viminalis]